MTLDTETTVLPRSTGRHARPVFVDGTGRRRRFFRRAGAVAGLILTGFLIIMSVTVATGASVPATPWSDQHGHRSQGRPATTSPGSKSPVMSPATGTHDDPGAGSGTEPQVAPAPSPGAAASPSPTTASPSATPTSPTASATSTHPGRSRGTPPAWGKTKKPR
jgi:hypothetical protein